MVGRHRADAYRRPNLVGPEINDTDTEVLWLIMGGPEKELEPAWVLDQKHLYPVDPTQLPVELKGGYLAARRIRRAKKQSRFAGEHPLHQRLLI